MGSVLPRRRARAVEDRTGEARWHRHALILPVGVAVSILWLEIVLRLHAQTPVVAGGLLYAALFAGVAAALVCLVVSLLHGALRTVVVGLSLGPSPSSS